MQEALVSPASELDLCRSQLVTTLDSQGYDTCICMRYVGGNFYSRACAGPEEYCSRYIVGTERTPRILFRGASSQASSCSWHLCDEVRRPKSIYSHSPGIRSSHDATFIGAGVSYDTWNIFGVLRGRRSLFRHHNGTDTSHLDSIFRD